MTLEDVISQVERETGKTANAETQIKDVVADSLEFLDLMMALAIPDEKVAGIETVQDLYLAVQ